MMSYFLQYNRYMNFLGIAVVLLVAWLFSKNKKAFPFRLVINGLFLQVILAYLVLCTNGGQAFVGKIADLIANIYAAADSGISFVFGPLANPTGPWGFIFGIKVLPIIIFFGALMSLMFYWGVIQRLVLAISYLVQPILGTSGAETLCAIANSFLGQTEAPLLIRHYIKNLTDSEILVVMVSGMGTISGAILAVYAAMGVPAKHLLSASVMAIPATIVIAKILYPETEKPSTSVGVSVVQTEGQALNIVDALAAGTSDGLQLALNVGAMLISFIALIGMINSLLSYGCIKLQAFADLLQYAVTIPCLTLQQIFGYICAPVGWLMGLQGDEMFKAGSLIGIKVAINEMVAYSEMVNMQLSERAVSLLTYALCGFSNFSCIGIQIGGIGALAPSKRGTLSRLGLYAVLGGTLANLLSAFIAGLLL